VTFCAAVYMEKGNQGRAMCLMSELVLVLKWVPSSHPWACIIKGAGCAATIGIFCCWQFLENEAVGKTCCMVTVGTVMTSMFC
jgi:hypothetical protein